MKFLLTLLRLARMKKVSTSRPAKPRLTLETLEERIQPSSGWESFDGTGNNLANPNWGSAGSDLLRIAPAAYADGVSAPAGADRPSARVISNTVDAQSASTPTNNRQMSDFVYAWGQFIAHDLEMTNDGVPADPFNIPVPAGDPQFDPTGTGTQVIPLNRSEYDPATGTGPGNPRQQFTEVTGWLDASTVYGSDAATAASLRTFSGGHLKTSAGDLLPLSADGNFVAGDARAEDNPELTAIQTLFLREHNRLADQIAAAHPGLSDEQIYQQARRLVIAEIQEITYNEFLPALLGQYTLAPYAGYNANVNPDIANEFSTAAYRFGHSIVGDDIEFLDNQGNQIQPAISQADGFFNPTILEQAGIDPVLKYLASDNAQEEDTQVVDSLRNMLFGAPGAGGLDLAALDIQRGRDHGLADYNTTRAAYGLPRVTSFAQITSDPTLQKELQQLYGNVNNIDLFVGGLAEDHLPGDSLGPTFTRIIADQFQRLRAGDRFWFENTFSGPQLMQLENTSLADVIRRNTSLTNLQSDVFFFRTAITGRVFVDQNANGQLDPGEPGIGGREVQLLSANGTVLQTTLTAPDGSYRFAGLDLGTYQVREFLPSGTAQTSQAIQLTRGMIVNGVNFAEAPTSQPSTGQMPPPPHQTTQMGTLGETMPGNNLLTPPGHTPPRR